MKRILITLSLFFIAATSFAQFADTAAAGQYIRDTIADRRPNKITSAQLQTALLGITHLMPNTSALPLTHNYTYIGNGSNIAVSVPVGTGISTWWATPSSSNLAAAITDETGTGVSVFNNSPLFISPRLNSTSTTGYVWTATNGSGNGSFQAATGGGVTTMAAIGSSPNANGATISGSTLNLQPASASFGGVITTGSQTVAGAKTFSSDAIINTVKVGLGGGSVSSNVAIGATSLAANSSGVNNISIGNISLQSLTSGQNNVSVGASNMYNMTTGNSNVGIGYATILGAGGVSNNTAIGYNSLNATSGNDNTAVGYRAMLNNTTGFSNVAMGTKAMYSNTTSANNVAIGDSAAFTSSTGITNVAVGSKALFSNTNNSNTAVGFEAMYSNINGANTGMGYQVMRANANGSGNAAFGFQAMLANTSGSSNSAFGYAALSTMISNSNCTAVGTFALQNGTAAYNTAVGANSAKLTSTGGQNTSVGAYSLYTNTTGGLNTVLGYGAIQNNTTASWDVAVGMEAMKNNTTGASNTAVGYQAGYSNTTSSNNTTVGYQAGFSGTGSNNSFFGHAVATNNTTGSYNSFFGVYAGIANTYGNDNTSVGNRALKLNTTGNSNTAIGDSALFSNTTGSQNVGIGYYAEPNDATSSGQLSIQNIMFGQGNTGTHSTVSTGNIGIGIKAPNANSILDLTATNRGLLIPRMSRATFNAITPTQGLLAYDNVTDRFVYSNGSTTKTLLDSAATILGYTLNNLSYPHTIFTPLTGDAITLITKNYNIINPAGTIATLTLALPSSPTDGDVVKIKFTQTVTGILYTSTVANAPTTGTAGTVQTLVYDLGTATWY